jgi:1,4-dihydroxy-2-naphthoate polyprenyltransferase
MMNAKNIWWQAVRFHFTSPSFFSVMIGTSYACFEHHQWDKISFFAILASAILHHIGLNLTDDYYDYKHGVDVTQQPMALNEKNLYAGGSGVLSSNLIPAKQMLCIAIICYVLTAAIGLLLVYFHGSWVLGLGFIGFFSSFYYTAPPLKLAYHGLGELLIFINFGPVLVLGSYFVQIHHKHAISFGAILISIIVGLCAFCLIIANELPDYPADLAANKKTLIVQFGKRFGIVVLATALVLIFGISMLAVIKKIWPITTLLTLLAIPSAYLGINKLATTIHTDQVSGNELIVKFCNVFGILLIFSFVCTFFYTHQTTSAIIFLLVTSIFYLPIIIFGPKISK